jgi:hypothetical protein
MREGELRVSQSELKRMHIVKLTVEGRETVGGAAKLLGISALDIPADARRRGYAKTRVEVRQLLNGRWRVYHKDDLLLETIPPETQTALRTLPKQRRKRKPIKTQKSQNGHKRRPH